jgi:hypothetical protein
MASSSTSSKRSTPESLISRSLPSLAASSSFSLSRSFPASSKFWLSTAFFFASTTPESSVSNYL